MRAKLKGWMVPNQETGEDYMPVKSSAIKEAFKPNATGFTTMVHDPDSREV
jgi:hypothetical protein